MVVRAPTPREVLHEAEQELERELRREAIEREKARLRGRKALPWWRRLIPFTIKIERIDR